MIYIDVSLITFLVGLALEEQIYPDDEQDWSPISDYHSEYEDIEQVHNNEMHSRRLNSRSGQKGKEVPRFIPHTEHDAYVDLVLTATRQFGTLANLGAHWNHNSVNVG